MRRPPWDVACARSNRLRFRAANLRALELPRRKAAMVQMVATDFRPPVELVQHLSERLPLGRGVVSKFEFKLCFAARHWITTYRTRRPCAPAAERAARLARWQSAAKNRFAGFLSEDWLIRHCDPPRMTNTNTIRRIMRHLCLLSGITQELFRNRFARPVGRIVRSARSRSWRAISIASASVSTNF